MDPASSTYSLASLVFEWLYGVIFGVFFVIILIKMWTGGIDLSGLVTERTKEGDPRASIARLQLLLVTFAITGSLVILSIHSGSMAVLPDHVLVLLGISVATYIVSEAMSRAPVTSTEGLASADGLDAPVVSEFVDDLIAADRFKTYLITLGKEVPNEVSLGMARLMADYRNDGLPAQSAKSSAEQANVPGVVSGETAS